VTKKKIVDLKYEAPVGATIKLKDQRGKVFVGVVTSCGDGISGLEGDWELPPDGGGAEHAGTNRSEPEPEPGS